MEKMLICSITVLPDRGQNSPPPLYQFIAKKQFFKYNLEKFLKYITFSSCSSIIFGSLPKLYLNNCFFSIECQNGGGKFHPRSGSTVVLCLIDLHLKNYLIQDTYLLRKKLIPKTLQKTLIVNKKKTIGNFITKLTGCTLFT